MIPSYRDISESHLFFFLHPAEGFCGVHTPDSSPHGSPFSGESVLRSTNRMVDGIQNSHHQSPGSHQTSSGGQHHHSSAYGSNSSFKGDQGNHGPSSSSSCDPASGDPSRSLPTPEMSPIENGKEEMQHIYSSSGGQFIRYTPSGVIRQIYPGDSPPVSRSSGGQQQQFQRDNVNPVSQLISKFSESSDFLRNVCNPYRVRGPHPSPPDQNVTSSHHNNHNDHDPHEQQINLQKVSYESYGSIHQPQLHPHHQESHPLHPHLHSHHQQQQQQTSWSTNGGVMYNIMTDQQPVVSECSYEEYMKHQEMMRTSGHPMYEQTDNNPDCHHQVIYADSYCMPHQFESGEQILQQHSDVQQMVHSSHHNPRVTHSNQHIQPQQSEQNQHIQDESVTGGHPDAVSYHHHQQQQHHQTSSSSSSSGESFRPVICNESNGGSADLMAALAETREIIS